MEADDGSFAQAERLASEVGIEIENIGPHDDPAYYIRDGDAWAGPFETALALIEEIRRRRM